MVYEFADYATGTYATMFTLDGAKFAAKVYVGVDPTSWVEDGGVWTTPDRPDCKIELGDAA